RPDGRPLLREAVSPRADRSGYARVPGAPGSHAEDRTGHDRDRRPPAGAPPVLRASDWRGPGAVAAAVRRPARGDGRAGPAGPGETAADGGRSRRASDPRAEG